MARQLQIPGYVMLGWMMMLTLPGPVWAHTQTINAPVVHNCTPPVRPENDQDDHLWRAFLREVDTFRQCVNDKMEWHRAAAAAHEQNAREVVQTWNRFVQVSLNAPEDFPYPPVETEEAE